MRSFLYFVPLVAALVSMQAHAQMVENDDSKYTAYKVVDGQVYMYDRREPGVLQLLPGVKPSQLGSAAGRADTTADGRTTVLVPSSSYGVPSRRHSTSNTALPPITFSDPAYGTSGIGYGNQRATNPIGGLPTYPGR